jgi:hypothetical protein
MAQHSKLYSAIFPEELMLAAFGTTRPSQSQKNEYFFNCWMEWKKYEMKGISSMRPHQFKTQVKAVCEQIGLKEFWDYQTRGFTVRFRDAEIRAFFKISSSGGRLQWII